MSATNRGAQRISNDHYRTPKDAVLPLYERIDWRNIETMVDPTAGDGRLLEWVLSAKTQCFGFELEACPTFTKHHRVWYDCNYLQIAHPPLYDLGLTNPPFSIADKVLTKMLRHCATVVLLQRINWLGGQNRASFWKENLPGLTHLLILGKRPAFVNNCSACGHQQHPESGKICGNCGEHTMRRGTDATEYAWYVWDRGGHISLPRGLHRLDA